jgi:hypothetical protein
MKTFLRNFVNSNISVPSGKYDVDMILSSNNSITSEAANIELGINLKVLATKNEAKVGQYVDSTKQFMYDRWSDEAWNFFLLSLELQANQVWDRKLWFTLNKFKVFTPEFQKVKDNFLITKDDKNLKGEPVMALFSRPIACRFNLQLVTDTGNPHHQIDVFYIKPTGTTKISNTSMGSTSSVMDFYDYLLYEGTAQSAIAHEVGHILGLPHIGVSTGNEDCILALKNNPNVGGNAKICYFAKGAGEEVTNNIMGIGTRVDARNADPWQKALLAMTGIPTNYWNISLVKETAFSAGAYGQVGQDSPLWREYHPLEKYNNWFKKDSWWERAI